MYDSMKRAVTKYQARRKCLSVDSVSGDTGMRLYVLYTGAGNEDKIIFQCRKAIIEGKEDVFCPIVEREKSFRGVEKTVWLNLYKGYVFVETDQPEDFFLRLRAGMGKVIFGYIQMLRDNEYILPLYPDEEATLRELMDAKHRVMMSYGYRIGDQAVITSGPLKDFKGKVVKYNIHRKFAVIETRILGEVRRVVVGADLLRKDKEAEGKESKAEKDGAGKASRSSAGDKTIDRESKKEESNQDAGKHGSSEEQPQKHRS